MLQGVKIEKKELEDVLERERSQLDEEDIMDAEDGIARQDKIWTYVMEVAGVLMRTSGAIAEPKIRSLLLPLYAESFQNFEKSSEDQLLNSLCFMCDVLEFGSDDLFNFLAPQAQTQIFRALQGGEVSANMAQTAIFALGVIAYRVPAGSFDVLEQAVKAVEFVFTQSYEPVDTGKRSTAEDNAVSALAKLVYVHTASNPAVLTPALINDAFLGKLPLISDNEEGQAVHLLFAQQIIANNAVFAAHAAEVKAAVARIIQYATEKPEEEILNDEGKAAFEQVNKLLA